MTLSAPLVSIVIPTFNRAREVAEAVRSCRAQTHPNCEIIVVDDGSTDGTAAVLATLAMEDGHALRTIVQVNAGASAARNAGLDACQGTYVQFLDSDDVLAVGKIAAQLVAIERTANCDVALSYGRLECGDGSERIGVNCGGRSMAYVEKLCSGEVHIVQTAAPLWRRDFLSGGRRWNATITLGDDLDFHARCLVDARTVVFVAEELFVVRYHVGNRLSDFSTDNRRLASLVATREAIFEMLAARDMWTRACAANATPAMLSLYVNYLRRMCDAELSRLEQLIARMCRLSAGSAMVWATIATRRVLGRGVVLAIADTLLGVGRRPSHPRELWRSIAWRVKRWGGRTARLRPSHALQSARSLIFSRMHSPEPRTVLLVEPNEFHTETLPGYVSLITAAGCNCWLLVRPRADVTGALSRLPVARRPTILVMNLWAMAFFLRSRLARRFDLIFFGSGTISERYGYFGGVLDYLGRLPVTRLGYLMIEHSDETLRERNDWRRLDPDRLFALSPFEKPDMAMKMLAPVDFGPVRRIALGEPVIFVTVGRVSPAYRNFAALMRAIEELRATSARLFKVVAIGAQSAGTAVPETVRSYVEFVGFQPFAAMYDRLDAAHFFLPLLDSSVAAHRVYMSGNTSGSRQLVLGFEKIAVWERPFADAYGFTESNAIVHQPGALADGMRRALALDPSSYAAKAEAVARMKREIFQSSLATFNAFLATHGDQGGCSSV